MLAMIRELHNQVGRTDYQSSNTGKQPTNNQNILSQFSSPPVPDRNGPVKLRFRCHHARLLSNLGTEQLLQGTPIANRASKVGNSGNRVLGTPTSIAHPQGPGHTAFTRFIVDLTDEIISSDSEPDEPAISALGKRDRPRDLGGRTEEKGSSGGEAKRPHKNRVSRVSLLRQTKFLENCDSWAEPSFHQGESLSF